MALPDATVLEGKGVGIPLPMDEVSNDTYRFGMGCPGSAKASALRSGAALNAEEFVEAVVFSAFPVVKVFG